MLSVWVGWLVHRMSQVTGSNPSRHRFCLKFADPSLFSFSFLRALSLVSTSALSVFLCVCLSCVSFFLFLYLCLVACICVSLSTYVFHLVVYVSLCVCMCCSLCRNPFVCWFLCMSIIYFLMLFLHVSFRCPFFSDSVWGKEEGKKTVFNLPVWL